MNDDRDLRDPALDALLREHSPEMPPEHVDAAILAAAHRAAESAPRPAGSAKATQSWRWWMPLTAAAVIGVVVIGIMPLAPTRHDEASTVSDSPATSPRDAAANRGDVTPSAPSEAQQPSAPPSFAPEPRAAESERQAPRPQSAAPNMKPRPESEVRRHAQSPAAQSAKRERAATAIEPPPAMKSESRSIDKPGKAAPSLKDEPAPAATSKQDQAGTSADDAHSSALPALAGPVERGDAPASDASEWIARIRTLRQEGNLPEAIRELARFRAAFSDADTRLPIDLQAWAKTLPR